MHNLLKAILEEKQSEVNNLKRHHRYLNRVKSFKGKQFESIFQTNELAIIGELKRGSPSKGPLTMHSHSVLLESYCQGGAAAVSVVTDRPFFSGCRDDLVFSCQYLKGTSLPVLRKDFIIDPIQINESIHYGADVVLLIVSILKDKTKALLDYSRERGVSAIVEVHDEAELRYAIDIGASVIGMNNRNLNTFEEDIETCLALKDKTPKSILTIAESAIRSVEDFRLIKSAGFNGVLIGEALVTADDPMSLLQDLKAVV